MKTYITFSDISTSMHEAGIESGHAYPVSKIIWKNGLIEEVHTTNGQKFHMHKSRIIPCTAVWDGEKYAPRKTCNHNLTGIDWALEFNA